MRPVLACESTPQSGNRLCPGGARINISPLGFSATGAFLYLIGNVGGEAGVSIPLASLAHGSLRGTQIYGSGSFSLLGGLGFFAGAGYSPSVGYSNGPIQSGVTGQHVVGAGAALLEGGELSVGTNGSGGSVSGGPDAGVGASVGYGGKITATAATPQLGC